MQQLAYQPNAQNAYMKQRIMTASPMELVIMLYDGCRKNLLLAQKDIEKNDAATAHTHLTKAQNIVLELLNSLDLSYSISKELMELYAFLINEIGEINAEKDAKRITPVLDIVGDLREAWEQVAQQQRQAPISLPAEGI